MFGLFPRRRNARISSNIQSNRTILALESLESRDCPSAPTLTMSATYGSLGSVALNGYVSDQQPSGISISFQGGLTGTVLTNSDGTFSYGGMDSTGEAIQAVATDAAGELSNSVTVGGSLYAGPVISDFTATQVSGQQWSFSGQVLDQVSSPSGLTVNFGGLPSLMGVTATTASNGTFSITETLQQNEVGLATAVTTDANGVMSNLGAALADASSDLSMSISYGAAQVVIVSGQVTGANAGETVVSFSGSAMGKAIPNSAGAFSVDLQATSSGTIQAVATDEWGVSSNQASVSVTVSGSTSGPIISNFFAQQDSGQTWTFSGQIAGTSMSGYTVCLGGLPSLSGVTATATSSGAFSTTVTLQTDEIGYATALATDANGNTSNLATTLVDTSSYVSLSISYGEEKMVILSGQVEGPDAAGSVVQFTGAATGSAAVKADGSFSVELEASYLGIVTAVATDKFGVQSYMTWGEISCAVPEITNYAASVARNNYWQFAGTVVAPSAPGLTVNFGGLGLNGSTAAVQPNGYFVMSAQLPAGTMGTVWATVTDWWGQTSEDALFLVTNVS